MKALYKRRGALDPRAVTFFIRKLGVYPPGSLVELSNGMERTESESVPARSEGSDTDT